MSVDPVFFDRVSHDLRGELATIMAGVHYVLRYDEGIGPVARQMLERVAGAGTRLTRELDELEDAAWLFHLLPRPLVLAPCQLDALLGGILERLKRGPFGDRAPVVVEPHAPGLTCVADSELLGTALEYSIELALARTEAEPVHIVVAVPDGGGIVVTITDAGGPVEPDRLERLFDPFAAREVIPKPAPGTRRRDRLGLGLSIAHRIFEAHGGELRAASSPAGLALDGAIGPLVTP